MQLLITLQFPFGRFHGREFPPSPSRLFQALIAGSHRGVYERQHAETRDRALEWLENLLPPLIAQQNFAPKPGSGVTNYVPNNDNSFAHIKTAKPLRAFVAQEDSGTVRYVWQFPDTEQNQTQAAVVCKMARLVTHLGHGQDTVFAHGELLPNDSAGQTDIATVWQPKEQAGALWAAPRTGALAAYKARYAQFLTTGNAHALPAPVRQVDYLQAEAIDLRCPYALFEMRRLDNDELFFGKDGRDVRQPVAMVRHALCEFFKNPRSAGFKRRYGADLIERKIFGHEPHPGPNAKNKSFDGSHLAIVPIPSLRPPHPDGWIRRVMLAGFGFAGELESELFNDVANQLNGKELKDNNESVGRLLQVENHHDDKFFQRFNGSSSRVWRSVTPVILPGLNRRGRKPEHLLYQALEQIGISGEAIASLAVFRGPIVPATFRPMDYRIEKSNYLNASPRYHAEIIFRRPVSGVLVVGKGRHAGFGLMMPVEKPC